MLKTGGTIVLAWNEYTLPYSKLSKIFSENGFTVFDNDHYIQLLNLADQETNTKLRAEHLKQAELLLLDEMPAIPIYSLNAKCLISDKIKGIKFSHLGEIEFKGIYIEESIVQK